jgi:hypothetical protein
MPAEARMQPESFEKLRSTLEGEVWNHDSLAEYVSEMAQDRSEEEIFRDMAFRNAAPETYEALEPGDQSRLRQWWHERIRREVYDHEDLRQRLSWRYHL